MLFQRKSFTKYICQKTTKKNVSILTSRLRIYYVNNYVIITKILGWVDIKTVDSHIIWEIFWRNMSLD